MAVSTIQKLRTICTQCENYETTKFIGNYRFEARYLDQIQSVGARYGIMETAQMVESNLMVIFPDALDGAEWKWEEILPGLVQSRSTGGLSKFQCGFDPQKMRVRRQIKRQHTERMYIHREECMLTYIGSTLQAGHQGLSPVYIRNNQTLMSVSEGRQFVIDLMVNDMRSMAKAIDGTVIMGDFTGGETGSIINNYASVYPHFDGILKQTLLNADYTYYASVDFVLPAVVGGAYFIKWGGNWSAAVGTEADVVTAINALLLNTTGTSPYTATNFGAAVGGTRIRVTANDPEADAYGEGSLEVYYSATGSVTDCDAFLEGTIIENPMPWAEQSLLFNYSTITEANFYDYFKDVIKEIKRKQIALFENGLIPEIDSLGRNYIAIDPNLLVEKEFSYLREMITADKAEDRLSRLDSMFPEFVPMKVLEGTGLWFWTYQSNVIFLTNVQDPSLPQTSIWYDQDCDQVKSRNEMLGNVLVADFNLVATNAKGSTFEAGLHPAYQPENLPHLSKEIRQNTCNGSVEDQFTVFSDVCWEQNGVNVDVQLVDASIVPDGSTIAAVVWTVYDSTGTPQVPGVQSTNTLLTLTQAQFDAITIVTYQVTLSTGETSTITIPKADIVVC